MKIICMGDSITFGLGLEADLSQRWTALVEEKMGVQMINRGISGDTTGGMLARCQTEVFPEQPDYLLILGGINDICLAGQYRIPCMNIAAMVKQADAKGVPVIMGLPLPIAPEDMHRMAWDVERDNVKNAGECEKLSWWLTNYCEEHRYGPSRRIRLLLRRHRTHFSSSERALQRKLGRYTIVCHRWLPGIS